MAKITITKGNEFMIAVRDEITKDDLFIEQYERAANILDRIVGTSIEVRDKKEFWKSQDYENNIIAFCGERGEGKSSVMMTFVNAIYHNSNEEIFLNCKNVESTYFVEPILIDPTLCLQRFFETFMIAIIMITNVQMREQEKNCLTASKRFTAMFL